MLKRFVVSLWFVPLVICSLGAPRADAATVDFTGTWSGTISGQFQCGVVTSIQTLDGDPRALVVRESQGSASFVTVRNQPTQL